MRLRRALLLGLLLPALAALAVAGVAPVATAPDAGPLLVPGPLSARPVRYRIRAELHPGAREVTGSVEVALRNTSRAVLRHARLHLYLNAFASSGTLFLREARSWMRGRRWSSDDPGWIEIIEVRQNGAAVRSHKHDDGTIFVVWLARPVAPGEELSLSLTFRARLPRLFARTGHDGKDLFILAQWYPKPGVLLEDGSWHCPAFHSHAEFFAAFASYDVTLALPAGHVVGATGVEVARRPGADGGVERRFLAEDVHDFAIVASPSLTATVSRSASGAELRLLSPPGRAPARVLETAGRGLALLERWFGRFPYRQLTIVDLPTRALGGAAMEYPTLFTVWAPSFVPRWLRFVDETTLHELTHQYFQGMLASNEVLEPWLDEGVTSYVTMLLLEELFGHGGSYVGLAPLALDVRAKEQSRIVGGRAYPVGWPAERFQSLGAYGSTVYARAALLLATVESLIGREKTIAALGDYARRFRFKHPRGADLEAALLAATAPELRPVLAELLDGAIRRGEGLDYRVRCAGDRVIVERRGPLALPVELELEGEGDHSFRRIAIGPGSSLFVARAPGLVRARLGPPGRLLLDTTPIDNACVPASGAPRAGLDLARLLQRLLPLVGP